MEIFKSPDARGSSDTCPWSVIYRKTFLRRRFLPRDHLIGRAYLASAFLLSLILLIFCLVFYLVRLNVHISTRIPTLSSSTCCTVPNTVSPSSVSTHTHASINRLLKGGSSGLA